MKLTASMNVKDELGRYLEPVVNHLLSYCDEVRAQDDGSEDGSFEWLEAQDRVEVRRNPGPSWSENEGALHQNLLDWTLEGEPTHVLAIDADEMVPEGQVLRGDLARHPERRTFALRMCEIWRRDRNPWLMRVDGGWRPHDVACCYQLPTELRGPDWQIGGRRMASGRVPRVIQRDAQHGRFHSLGLDILHLGWSDPAERQARYDRYAELDAGEFHAKAHLDSIMLPDEKIGLVNYRPPETFPIAA